METSAATTRRVVSSTPFLEACAIGSANGSEKVEPESLVSLSGVGKRETASALVPVAMNVRRLTSFVVADRSANEGGRFNPSVLVRSFFPKRHFLSWSILTGELGYSKDQWELVEF